ncbi:hypothetical protein CLU96_1792 [Chryseobacterium sp. 52]|uniref:hypothetical protein n=1 Tax=Chryseobacterium sp. 52 TaxID=2035213 RepID=UPI000C181C1B|nr:hypothetical protein [Chryseobacterium sp. 52]PIF44798.1 hypothetical protein CLU96_1792 [Chryseobacterium sp. 52]
MTKILYSFLIFSSAILFAQKSNNVKFTICNNVVGTAEMFESHKKEIESFIVFKATSQLPQHLKKFNYLAENGLSEVKLKKNAGTPDIISLAALNEQNTVPKDKEVIIDGYKFNDTTTEIYSEIIHSISVKEDNGEKYLSISTSDK